MESKLRESNQMSESNVESNHGRNIEYFATLLWPSVMPNSDVISGLQAYDVITVEQRLQRWMNERLPWLNGASNLPNMSSMDAEGARKKASKHHKKVAWPVRCVECPESSAYRWSTADMTMSRPRSATPTMNRDRHRGMRLPDHRSSMHILRVLNIFTNIKTGYKYYNLIFSLFNIWKNKAQIIVQNQLQFITPSPIDRGTGYCLRSISLFVCLYLCFFVSKIMRKRLDWFARNFQGRCGVTMARPDYILAQFRETARCRDAQYGDGVCCRAVVD